MACSGGGPLKGHFCKREQVGSNENVIPKRKLSNIVVRGKDQGRLHTSSLCMANNVDEDH